MMWHVLLFAVSVSISTSTALQSKDSGMIKPDECKEKRLCATKLEGNENVELKINSSVPDLPAEDYNDKEVVPGVQRKRRSIDVGKQNCIEKVMQDLRYNYMVKKSSDIEIIETCPYLRQLIKVVRCGPLPSPLSYDSSEQCFQDLLEQDKYKKSSCETSISNHTQIFHNEDKTKYYSRVFLIPVACSCIVSYKYNS